MWREKPISGAIRGGESCGILSASGRLRGERTMLINEILRVKGSRLLSIAADGRAVDAVRTMAEENLGSLVVMEGSRMLGMLTFHEILQALHKGKGSLG